MSVLAVLVALSLTPCVRPALALSPGQAQGRAWDAGFFLGGLEGGGHALATYDDGSGPALYVGGSFTSADDVPASRIVRWDGRRYEALGSGLAGTSSIQAEVRCLAVFDDGTGPELYAGGRFTRAGSVNANGIAKWNGSRWAAVGAASSPSVDVRALAVFDDGSGPALYAAGQFSAFGGLTTDSIARWNGSAWAPVGLGIGSIHSVGPGEVEALAVFQGKLYAGGEFAKADGLPAHHLACWDGAKWRALGAGARNEFGSTASVYALETCRDERGEFLAIGGDFDLLDERPAPGIGRFDGHDFATFGAGLRWGRVTSLAQLDDGRGKALYAGGGFFLPDGGPRVSIARWDGRTWAVVGDDLSVENGTAAVTDLEVFDGGQGKTLFAVGGFGHSGTHAVRCLAELKEGDWRSLTGRGQGMVTSINSASQSPAVRAFEVWDDGLGEALYAAGEFIAAGTAAALRIARFDGSEWVPVGEGPWALGGGSHVQALRAFDDGTGSSLYAGGDFTHLGSQAIPALARWDGVAWWPVGGGIGFSQPFGFRPDVRALAVFDDGNGPALYAGGVFDLAGGAPASGLARWDGTSWSDVGGGVSGTLPGIVTCMAVLDDGSGPALYVGGGFDAAGGVSAHSIARWDGMSWSDVGSGASDPFNASLMALQVFDDGTGPALYAGGAFRVGNGAVANNLARWNGQAWSAVGSGFTSDVHALEVHDDGSGPALYAGGEFTRSMTGQTLLRVARWDGASWSTLGSGLDGGFLTAAHALKSFRLDGIPRLFVGGQFTSAGGRRALDVACWSDVRRRRAR
jgi:hypothetical protein